MTASPPLRFLAIVLGGWAALRTALLAPSWTTSPPAPSPARVALHGGWATGPPSSQPAEVEKRAFLASAVRPWGGPARRKLFSSGPVPPPAPPIGKAEATDANIVTAAVSNRRPPDLALPRQPNPVSARRWSLSAWSFVRRAGAPPLAAGGLLGGSQAGARLSYRLNRDSERPLALSVRLSSPLRSLAGAEAALGLDWQPIRRLPIHLLAERRQALGRDGRSAFGLTALGDVSDVRLGRFRVDAYAQAGVVGGRSRDLFGDGSIRVSLPLDGKIRLGAGAWAAAQPGLSRLDLGPQAALRLPVPGRAVTLAADWRLRVAGSARPGSGPTLTLATDF